MASPQLGFFTRLLDHVPAQQRYELALAQIQHAEEEGFDNAAVAQHHFHANEGGLPSPLVFLAHVAASTRRIRLGTGVITLPLENEVRVAEDAIVLDLLSGGRLELGIATGGTPSSFTAFGRDFAQRRALFRRQVEVLTTALRSEPLDDEPNIVYPEGGDLIDRVWIATFSSEWAREAGRRGHGLLLARTQPPPESRPDAALDEIQNELIDAYLGELPSGAEPRISVARTLFVADDHEHAINRAVQGHRRSDFARSVLGAGVDTLPAGEMLAAFDVHAGTSESVLESLSRDTALPRATHLSFQVHSVDPPHEEILRSIELTAREVAPVLGWRRRSVPSVATRAERGGRFRHDGREPPHSPAGGA